MTIKMALRTCAANFLSYARITAPERRAGGRLSIATFHRVLPDALRQAYPYRGLAVTPEELDALLAYFGAHYDCGSLATQYDRYLAGTTSPRPLMAMTFDDGQHDNYQYALPLLEKRGIKATFFIPVLAVEKQQLLWHDRLGFAISALLEESAVGERRLDVVLSKAGLARTGTRSIAEEVVRQAKRLDPLSRARLVDDLAPVAGPREPDFARLMTFDELASLARAGHEIGSHSMSHPLLPECSDSALSYEASKSREILRDCTGQPVESFCYPNGDSDERCRAAVAQAGYRLAVTTRWGNNGKETDR